MAGLELSEILKVWAGDSLNVESFTQEQIGAGIELNQTVVSDQPNGALRASPNRSGEVQRRRRTRRTPLKFSGRDARLPFSDFIPFGSEDCFQYQGLTF